MMKLKKLLLVLVMLLAPLSVGAQEHCYPFFTELGAPYGGTFQADCNICETYVTEFEGRVRANCQISYQNYSAIPELVANGGFSLELDMSYYLTYGTAKFTFDGGPVHFSYRNENYEVFFNEMFFNISISPIEYTITDVGGGLTVNGQYVPATPELFDLLLSL